MLQELMSQLQPLIINTAITILTAIAAYVGVKVKEIIQEKANTETKKKIVETTCKYVEQVCDDLASGEKYLKAKEAIVEQLNAKGISITELELEVLIEATVNSFKNNVSE